MQISETEHLEFMDQLRYFLATAPSNWSRGKTIQKLPLPNGECISCIFWNNLFFVTGTDIVRCLAYRFEAFGRPVANMKKFEEGVFSDLRNLKPGLDAILEPPRSEFLEMLFRNNCIRTQKKQKVFFWYSVPHDRLFIDALERDLKRDMKKIPNITHDVNHIDPLNKSASKTKPKLYPSPTQSLIPPRADLFMVGDVASLSSGATTTSNHNKQGTSGDLKARGLVSPTKQQVSESSLPNPSNFNSSMDENLTGMHPPFNSNLPIAMMTPKLVSSPPKEVAELPSNDGGWGGNRSMSLGYGAGGPNRYMSADTSYHSDSMPSWTQSSPYPHAVHCPSPGKFEASPYFTPQLDNTPVQDQGAFLVTDATASALGYAFLPSSSTPVMDPSSTFDQPHNAHHYPPPVMDFGMDGHSVGGYPSKHMSDHLNSVPEYAMLPPLKPSAENYSYDFKSSGGLPSRHHDHSHHDPDKSRLLHQSRINSMPYTKPPSHSSSHTGPEESLCLSWDALNDVMPQWNEKSRGKSVPSGKHGIRSSMMPHIAQSPKASPSKVVGGKYRSDDHFDKQKIEGSLENRLPSILKRSSQDFNGGRLLDGFM